MGAVQRSKCEELIWPTTFVRWFCFTRASSSMDFGHARAYPHHLHHFDYGPKGEGITSLPRDSGPNQLPRQRHIDRANTMDRCKMDRTSLAYDPVPLSNVLFSSNCTGPNNILSTTLRLFRTFFVSLLMFLVLPNRKIELFGSTSSRPLVLSLEHLHFSSFELRLHFRCSLKEVMLRHTPISSFDFTSSPL